MRSALLICLALSGCASLTPASSDFAPEPPGYWTGPIHSQVPATLQGGTVLTSAADVRQVLDGGKAVFVDASDLPHRPEQSAPGSLWLPPPHRVIPGSLWLPGSGLAGLSATENENMRQRVAALTGSDLERTVVVYCHERCWYSWNAAKRVISFGYRHVIWFPGGIEAWQAADYPTRSAEATAILEKTVASH